MGVGTKPQARRVMAAGGEWQEGIMATEADHPQWAERLLDPRDGHCWDFLGEHGGDWLPDLNDAATCAVLEAQAVERITSPHPGARVLITHVHKSGSVESNWMITVGSFTEPLFLSDGPRADSLAAAFEWLASLEVV
jgi:hypothetical protein